MTASKTNDNMTAASFRSAQ